MKTIKVGSDFSGVGAFDYAIERVSKVKKFEIENIFACDMDKYARQSYLANHKEPNYYPENVYDREIPSESLDIYMTSPPCQAFSIVGKRKGKTDKRGILFFNSHEFIQKNNPRYFIFENVKGLLSDDAGKTFQEWVNMLGGKSVNGVPILFPYKNSVPYHLYWKVLNSKKHGVPQNRERVFIIGIRDDSDNIFQFPKEEPLNRKIKDILEIDVDSKYFLSEKMINGFLNKRQEWAKLFKPKDVNAEFLNCITTSPTDKVSCNYIKVNNSNSDNNFKENISIGDYRKDEGFRWLEDSNSPCLHTQLKDIDFNEKRGQSSILVKKNYNIRRLTPLECFRLQDFPDCHVENSRNTGISDTQIYKQAGNSITVRVLEKIIEKFNL